MGRQDGNLTADDGNIIEIQPRTRAWLREKLDDYAASQWYGEVRVTIQAGRIQRITTEESKLAHD